MSKRNDRIRARAVRQMCSLILQAVGNISRGDHGSLRFAIELLTAALKLEGEAAGWAWPIASSVCPHCGVDYPHQHVIDRKGKVHS